MSQVVLRHGGGAGCPAESDALEALAPQEGAFAQGLACVIEHSLKKSHFLPVNQQVGGEHVWAAIFSSLRPPRSLCPTLTQPRFLAPPPLPALAEGHDGEEGQARGDSTASTRDAQHTAENAASFTKIAGSTAASSHVWWPCNTG